MRSPILEKNGYYNGGSGPVKCAYIDHGYEYNTIRENDTNVVRAKPCCFAHWNLIPDSIKFPLPLFDANESVTNHRVVEWFRLQSQGGSLPTSCKTCIIQEKNGAKSPRISANEDYDPNYDIYILDVNTGNECNLACAMCNTYSSSLIKKEILKAPEGTGPEHWQHKQTQEINGDANFAQLEQILRKHRVQIVKFKGGEPMLKRNWQNIERALLDGQFSDTNLRITTNGTNLNSRVLETLSLAKSVKITVSVDGIGSVGEFVRWPQKANKIQETLDNMAANSYSNIKFNTSTIITMLNIGDIENIYRKCKPVADHVSFDFDLKPEGNALDYRNIPVEIRARIRNSIDPQILYKKTTPLRNLIDIEHDGWNHPEEVRRTLDWFEDHRKQDLKTVLHPEVYKWYGSLHSV